VGEFRYRGSLSIVTFLSVAFVQISALKTVFLCKLNFDPISCILLSILMKFDTADVHKTSLRGCEFRENRLGEIHTVLKGVNEFLPIVST
jgi:hypothetical protein